MGVGMKKPSWSYSSIKLYEQCPRKYYHLKVKRDFVDPPTEATKYGEEFHEAAEFYVAGTAELPKRFRFAKKALDRLIALPGDKLPEYKLGLTENLEPCAIDAENVWWRGIADLVIINGKKARVVDYKTGASAKYADKDQLELMAMAVFQHFPEVEEVDAALFFVIAKAFIKEKYHRKQRRELWQNWLARYKQVIVSTKTGVWNPKTSGLCRKHCVVLSCIHNGRNM